MARNVVLICTTRITVIIRTKTYLLSFTCRGLSLQDARIHGFDVLYQQAKKLFIEAKHKLCRKEIRGEKSLPWYNGWILTSSPAFSKCSEGSFLLYIPLKSAPQANYAHRQWEEKATNIYWVSSCAKQTLQEVLYLIQTLLETDGLPQFYQ